MRIRSLFHAKSVLVGGKAGRVAMEGRNEKNMVDLATRGVFILAMKFKFFYFFLF